jgi:uncharacterized protein YgiM (DUF1202 family)
MPMIPRRATSWLGLSLAGLLCLALLPAIGRAQEAPSLAPGVTAQVANAGGDEVMLREGPGYDAAVLAAFAEGTVVSLTDGPIAADDGSTWYGVTVDGTPGYMVADFLVPLDEALPAPDAAAPATDLSAPALETTTALPDVAEQTTGETAVATEAVNLRAEPRADAPILLVVPAGGGVNRTGDISDGFAPVSYNGTAGWASIAYLTLGAAPVSTASDLAQSIPAAIPTGEGEATANDVLNLRDGPSTAGDVLRVLPPGAPVTITGEAADGFVPVMYNGTTGWVDGQYLDTGVASAAQQVEAPASASEPGAGPATTTDSVNLRSGPSAGASVDVVLPTGAAVETTGPPQAGFYPVSAGDQTGWVSGDYLRFGDGATPVTDASPAGGSGIIWPVSGGDWTIMQGYNGSSHQNQDGLWQYYYSLDLARVDGDTAGQAVRSPVSGTVRWLDPSTGGMSIDIGDGHAVAFFHVTVDPSFTAGDPITQGQAVGTISGPGGPGYAGVAHIHLTLWETTDGGNWSRSAAPFAGPYAISGQAFPDTGGGNQYEGTEFTP